MMEYCLYLPISGKGIHTRLLRVPRMVGGMGFVFGHDAPRQEELPQSDSLSG